MPLLADRYSGTRRGIEWGLVPIRAMVEEVEGWDHGVGGPLLQSRFGPFSDFTWVSLNTLEDVEDGECSIYTVTAVLMIAGLVHIRTGQPAELREIAASVPRLGFQTMKRRRRLERRSEFKSKRGMSEPSLSGLFRFGRCLLSSSSERQVVILSLQYNLSRALQRQPAYSGPMR